MENKDISHSPQAVALVERALREDLGPNRLDATSQALVPAEKTVVANLNAREKCVLSGAPIAKATFQALNPDISVDILARDSSPVEKGETVMKIEGSARSILSAERTALNFIQRMSGIATLASRYVHTADNPGVMILDTRKTTPTLRILEKYAVECGGGVNHRFGLYDRIMIKDNHLSFWKSYSRKGIGAAILAAKKTYPQLLVEVEVDTPEQLLEVVSAKPDWVLLDNMNCDQLRECVDICAGVCRTEASGGISLATVADVAQTGVDAISVGALTHSAQAIDLALDFS